MNGLAQSKKHQGGTSLIVAIVALVAMMTAGLALIRTVESGNLAASNFQFQKTAEQNIDLAINEALLGYMQSSPIATLQVMDRNVDNPTVAYWASQQAETDGVPNALLTLPAPGWGANGPLSTGWAGEQVDLESKQLRRYMIERLCTGVVAGEIATAAKCKLYTVTYPSNSFKGTGSEDGDSLPYVRITVRVDGPKGSTAYAQMFLKGE